jgi:hypothetical protein
MPRAAADTPYLARGIVQKAARPIFLQRRRLPRLLEKRFQLQALQIGGLYSARPI